MAEETEFVHDERPVEGREVVPVSDAIANVRAKAQSVAKQQRAVRWGKLAAIVLVVVGLVVALGFYVVREVSPGLEERQEVVPPSAVDDGFIVELAGVEVPQADVEPANIQVYLDYKATASAQFLSTNSSQLEQWLRQGAIALTYHPVVLLTPAGDGPQYARRAANALACVATYSPQQVFKYNDELALSQPSESLAAPTNDELFTLAVAVGGDDLEHLEPCIIDAEFDMWVTAASTRAIAGPIAGVEDTKLDRVPMVFVNGKQYVGPLGDAVAFSQFVLSEISSHYFDETPTPEPSPTDEPDATQTPSPDASETPST